MWTRSQVQRPDYHRVTDSTSPSYDRSADPRHDPRFNEVWASHHSLSGSRQSAFPVDVPSTVSRRVRLRVVPDYTVASVRQYPRNLFLFPDSALGCGRQGAASIRDEPNATGIVVGSYPGDSGQPLFSDATYATSCRIIDSSLTRAIRRLDSATFTDLVLPTMDMCAHSPDTAAVRSHIAHRIDQLRVIFDSKVVLTSQSPIPPSREMPPWYCTKLFDGDIYPYIKSKLGITVPYDRGRHTHADFSAMCTSRPDDVALIAAKYRLSSIQALDIFLCRNHTLFDDVDAPGPSVRKTTLTELDDVLRRRDTRSAAEQSLLESEAAVTPMFSSWAVSRASVDDDFTALLNTRDVDAARLLVQKLTTGTRSGDLYLYSDMDGASMDRRFISEPYSQCPVQVLRSHDSFVGIPVATAAGKLYDLTNVTHATARWKAVFETLHILASKPTCKTVHFPHHMFGTCGPDGIDMHSDLFSKLMYRIGRFGAVAENDTKDILGVHLRDGTKVSSVISPYTLYRTPSRTPYDRHVEGTPSDTASAMRRLRTDPSIQSSLQKLPSMRILHGEHQMLRALESCTSFRHIWLADLLESTARVRSMSPPPCRGPHGDAWLRKQHPTILAPIHPDGLQRFQAGPIVPVQLNGHTATAMLDSGFTSNFAADYCIVQPEFCALHGIAVDTSKKSRVALADGTVSNTAGTASMRLQVGDRRPETIFMKVLHMPPGSPVNNGEGFDILLGFTWMLNREMSLWHERGSDGVITPGLRYPNSPSDGTHTLIPYVSHWDRSRSEIQAFTITSLEHNVLDNYWTPRLRRVDDDEDDIVLEGAEVQLPLIPEDPDFKGIDRDNSNSLKLLTQPDDFDICDEDRLGYRDTCTDAYYRRLNVEPLSHKCPDSPGHLCNGEMQPTTTTEAYLRETSASASQHVAQIRLASRNLRKNTAAAGRDTLSDTHVDFWTTAVGETDYPYCASDATLGALDDEPFLRALDSKCNAPLDLSKQLAPSAYHSATKINHLKVHPLVEPSPIGLHFDAGSGPVR